MPQFRQFANNFSLRGPGFKPRILDVESMIDEVKDKVVSMHTINADKGSVCLALNILNLSTS